MPKNSPSADGSTRRIDFEREAVDGALEEFRKANAAFYIEKAEHLREKILAAKADRTSPCPPVTK
ncbi:MAG: hypothetical protein M3178_02865 [Pseudomonadota bacterium]|nr:hypothetical protein [Pseudomonadota bacterium]